MGSPCSGVISRTVNAEASLPLHMIGLRTWIPKEYMESEQDACVGSVEDWRRMISKAFPTTATSGRHGEKRHMALAGARDSIFSSSIHTMGYISSSSVALLLPATLLIMLWLVGAFCCCREIRSRTNTTISQFELPFCSSPLVSVVVFSFRCHRSFTRANEQHQGLGSIQRVKIVVDSWLLESTSKTMTWRLYSPAF
jgi:hypothetical protein